MSASRYSALSNAVAEGQQLVGRDAGLPRRLTVLQSFRPPGPQTNPYLIQLMTCMPADIDVQVFSWRQALLGRFEVFHAHWPEVLLRGSDRPRTIARHLLFVLLLLRIRLGRIAVVRTLHNLGPHEAGNRFQTLLLRRFADLTTLWVRLNASTPVPETGVTVLIPHGHYRDWFAQRQVPDSVTGRLLYFGLIRPYKGVDGLLDAFSASPDPQASLHVVGKPVTPGAEDLLRRACERDSRITALLHYVDDGDLCAEVGQSQLVVLPFRDMHNSGSVLLALSLNRPVLVPKTPVNRAISDEVGPGWVLMYDGDRALATTDLRQAVATVRGRARLIERPDLSRRNWDVIGRQHREAYQAASAAVRRTR